MKTKTMYRSYSCDEISEQDVGKEISLCGYVDTIRDMGGILFIDLRDFYGITQVVVSGDDKKVDFASKIPVESTIKVDGKVKLRDEETINLAIKTGTVELFANKIEILGKRTKPLPYDISNNRNVREDLRLEYRFLDLRNEKIHNNIKKRSKILKDFRDEMDKAGFTEIQTPILANSSPEGARDFLVPSRLHPGEFYALPQAPQQFKQLLMVSGFDKYYQIAPCFRDEDPRADRSPR